MPVQLGFLLCIIDSCLYLPTTVIRCNFTLQGGYVFWAYTVFWDFLWPVI